MSEGNPEQQSEVRTVLATLSLILGIALLLSAPVLLFSSPATHDVSASAIKDSAMWPAFLWCLGWPILLARRRALSGEIGETAAGLRFIWTLGCLLCLIHIAIAFHLGHGWSHEAAWEHTRQVAGYGNGIYVNYLFALVWLADVIWAWVAFDSYRARPRWLNWTIHGFLAFVVFNAAVVFGTNLARRIAFALMFLISLAVAWMVRRIERKAEVSKNSNTRLDEKRDCE
ncbi:MAG: hypothetical protein L0241_10085 [Planctomycetia bacterium]|nr:hypothetical protein [Planctomycetia bacterium]